MIGYDDEGFAKEIRVELCDTIHDRQCGSTTYTIGCRYISSDRHMYVTSRLHSDLYPTYDVRVFPGSRVSELGE